MIKGFLGYVIVFIAIFVFFNGCREKTKNDPDLVVCKDSKEMAMDYIKDNHLKRRDFSKDSKNYIKLESYPNDCKSNAEGQLIALCHALFSISRVIHSRYSEEDKHDEIIHKSQSDIAGLSMINEFSEPKMTNGKEVTIKKYNSMCTITKDNKILFKEILFMEGESKINIYTSYDEIIAQLNMSGINVNVLKTFRDEMETCMIFQFSFPSKIH